MKRIRLIFIFVSVLLTFSLITSAAWASTPADDQGPTRPTTLPVQAFTGVPSQARVITGGIQSLSGSNVTFAPAAGGAYCFNRADVQTFCFQSDSYTNDWEYVYSNWLKFPADWVVSDVYVKGTPTCAGGSWGSFTWSFQTVSNEVNITHPRYQSYADHCVSTYCVDVMTSLGTSDVNTSWFFDGDGYNYAPHNPCSNDGYTPAGQNACDQATNPPALIPACTPVPGVILYPPRIQASGCRGEEQVHTFTLLNDTGTDATFSLSYLTDFVGNVSGPVSITLANGASTTFDVALQPYACLDPDVDIHVTIQVTNGIHSDSAEITKDIDVTQDNVWKQIATDPVIAMDNVLATYEGKVWNITGYGSTGVSNYDPATDTWATVADSAPGFANYARSGCQIGSKVYIYGDTISGYTGLWSYDMASNAWLQETPTGTAPAQNAIWAPSWVADEDNGLCYMTGGATAPGNGNLASVYVYDAINNQWLTPLPDFSTMRDFHAAFFFNRPADGHDLLCVAGGISTSAALASTQCYDFSSAAWNAENADLGATPLVTWGMGYTLRPTAAGDQLWLVNGVGTDGNLHGQNWYYDVAGGTWYDAGPLPSGVVYRTAAIALNGEVYHVGGSSAGFSPNGSADRYGLYLCTACTDPAIKLNPEMLTQVIGLDSTVTRELSVCNIGGAPLDYALNDGGTLWLDQDPSSGTVLPGECAFPDILFDSTAIPAVNYYANLTVTNNSIYSPVIDVPVWMVVTPSPDLEYESEDLEVNVGLNGSADRALTLANSGDAPLHWQLVEWEPVLLNTIQSQPQGEWLYRASKGVLLEGNNGLQMAYPSAYHWSGNDQIHGGGYNVLVYADEWIHTAPNTLVDQALRYLGSPYTAYYDGNFEGFLSALQDGGPWDLVLFANDNWIITESVLDDLNDYVRSGGKLIIHSWCANYFASHPLWNNLGITLVANDNDPPDPVYWWWPDHPYFTYFDMVPEFSGLTSVGDGIIYGQSVEPLGDFTSVAGYSASPAPNQAAIVTRSTGGDTIFKAFIDVQNNADLDGDNMLDGAELWSNLILSVTNWSYSDIPWLTTSLQSGGIMPDGSTIVNIHFNAVGLPKGNYPAALVLFNTSIRESPVILPLEMRVVNFIFLPVINR